MVPSQAEMKRDLKSKMLDSVTETTITRALHVDHESKLGFTNTKIGLPHGLGSAVILTSACGLCRVLVSNPRRTAA